MHELSIISNVFNIVEEVAKTEGLLKVIRINLLVGKLNQVVPEMMSFAFETISVGTISEKAELNIIEVPIKMHCSTCNNNFEVDDKIFICPHCGGFDLTILEGKELFIKSIEGEK